MVMSYLNLLYLGGDAKSRDTSPFGACAGKMCRVLRGGGGVHTSKTNK